MLELVDNEELEISLAELGGCCELTDLEVGGDQVGGEEVGGGDLVVDVVADAEDLDADLELDLDAREELALEGVILLLDVGWNCLEVVDAGVGGHEVGDLVVEVADLSLEDDAELEEDAELLGVVVLGLELCDLVLTFSQLLLEGLGLLGLEVGGLELLLEVGGALEGVL